jgi:hypothetical protein
VIREAGQVSATNARSNFRTRERMLPDVQLPCFVLLQKAPPRLAAAWRLRAAESTAAQPRLEGGRVAHCCIFLALA